MKIRLLFAGLWVSLLLGQQSPPNPAQVPQVQSGDPAILEGKTISLSGQPIKKTTLTLRPNDVRPGETPRPYTTSSDAEGKFIFEALEPGKYQLWAERPGFIRQIYGAKTGQFQGTILNLIAGQHLKDVTIQLLPQAVVSGKVLDEDGDPVGPAMVQVMKQAYLRGKRQMVPTSGAPTDESGEFKLSDLAPGRYYLCASAMNQAMFMGENARSASPGEKNKPREAFITTCYPSATDVNSAAPIDIMAGHDVPGIDVKLRKGPVVSVKGSVVGVPKQSERVRIMLSSNEPGGNMINAGGNGLLDKNGNFDLRNVRPGSYTLIVASMQNAFVVLARQPLDVGNESIEGVTIAVVSPVEVKGTVKIEDEQAASVATSATTQPRPGSQPGVPAQSAPSTSNIQITLSSADGVNINPSNSIVSDDKSFVLKNVTPGKYRLFVNGAPDGAYLKSVRLNNQEVLTTGIDFSQAVSGELEVVFRTAAAQVTGIVNNDKTQPAQGAIITLIPDPPQPEQTSLYKQTSTDQSGQFTLKNIVPGKYRVYAWESLDQGAQSDPEFLKAHESQSVAVSLDENGHEQINVKLITSGAINEIKQKNGR